MAVRTELTERTEPEKRGQTVLSITAFCCHNALYGGADVSGLKKADAEGVHKIELPCSGRLEPIHILKAFENGADGVVVVACPPRECRLIEGSSRMVRRIAYTRELMAETGLGPERLVLYNADRPAAPKFNELINEARSVFEKIGPSPLKKNRGSAP